MPLSSFENKYYSQFARCTLIAKLINAIITQLYLSKTSFLFFAQNKNKKEEKNKMKILKNRPTAFTIVVLLGFSISASFMLVQNANAHTPPWNVPTYSFINIAPNPIGVGQQVNVNFFVGNPPPTASGVYGDRWHGLTVEVTDPDGLKTTLGPFSSDDTGGSSTRFTPDKIGDYKFQFFFPGQTLTNENPGTSHANDIHKGDYYQPSESAVYTLVVQQEPISFAPLIPLPTEYWTRPIYAQNNDLWYAIGGNWLGLQPSTFANTGQYDSHGSYAPYTTAPNSAHIMWTKLVAFGGTMGGEFGSDQQSNYWSTSQYQPKFAPVIIHGILYYTSYPGSTANPAGIKAVNLHTGEDLWTIDNKEVLRCGQIMNFLSPNEYGGRGYIWTTGTSNFITSTGSPVSGVTYNMYDALTGEYVLSIVNGSSFNKLLIDDHGGLIGYYTNSSGGKTSLTVWNSTKTILRGTSGTNDLNNAWQWRPEQDGIYNFQNGIEFSVPIATKIDNNTIALSITGVDEDSGVVLMQYNEGQTVYFNAGWFVGAGYDMNDGHLIWGPTNRTVLENTRILTAAEMMGNGVFLEINSEVFTVEAYSLTTGNSVWGPVTFPNINPFSKLGMRYCPGPNGTELIWTYGGDVYSLNMADGTFNWDYHAPPSGYESPYGTWPIWSFSVGTVADGKLFVPIGHMYSPPLFHHAQQLALNLTDGTLVWSITAFDVTSAPAISDGIMVTLNAYDNQLYAWGKGPTKMTVTAPKVAVDLDRAAVISGTIYDISAGASQESPAARFANGLPCVSEASQQAFMEYVYMQQPKPTNTTGVPVSIDVIDSNGNYRNIGTTTSDASGMFTFSWTPDITGDYTVVASFAGSESYYAASAETSFTATEPAPTASPIPVTSMPPTEMYFAASTIAIIVAIAIVGFLILRKKP